MLRITRINSEGSTLLRLEGKLLHPWIDEVLSELGKSRPARLDLSQLSYVDSAGGSLLRDLIRGGVKIEASSSFITELLRMENP
jgi:ABC-type transporter Mla MlaB component